MNTKRVLLLVLLAIGLVFNVACSESIFSKKGGHSGKDKNVLNNPPTDDGGNGDNGDGNGINDDDDDGSPNNPGDNGGNGGNGGDDDSDDDDDNNGTPGYCSNLENYHQLYASIEDVVIKVKSIEVRTNKSEAIKINMPSFEINLQDLTGTGKGFPLDLRKIVLENNATEIDIVEVLLELDMHGRVEFDNEPDCKLTTNKQLVLYTTQPIRVDINDQYLVKVPFESLHAIQLTVTGGKKYQVQNQDYAEEMAQVLWGGSDHNPPPKKNECNEGKKDCKLRCELACRRAEIADITRFADEF